MGKKVLYVSSFPTHPVRGGFQARIRVIVEYLKELGVDLYFLYIDEGKDADIAGMQAFYGKNRFHVIKASQRKVPFLLRVYRGLRRRLIALLCARPSPYVNTSDVFPNGIRYEFTQILHSFSPQVVTTNLVFLSEIFEWCSHSTKKILDVHDKFSDRHKVYLEQGRAPEWYSISPKDEARAVRRADVLMAIQDKEGEYFEECSGKPTFTVGHRVRLAEVIVLEKLSETPSILFFASKGGVNARSYEFLTSEVLPLIRAQIPNVIMFVPGNIYLRVDPVDSVQLLGPVENIKSLYEKSWVIVNPAEFGTGLKIKNIEALGYGKALVTSYHGAIGLESGIDTAFQCAEGAEGFADKLIACLSDKEKCLEWSKRALNFAKSYNEEVERSVKEVFELA